MSNIGKKNKLKNKKMQVKEGKIETEKKISNNGCKINKFDLSNNRKT